MRWTSLICGTSSRCSHRHGSTMWRWWPGSRPPTDRMVLHGAISAPARGSPPPSLPRHIRPVRSPAPTPCPRRSSRLAAAAEIIRSLAEARVPALVASFTLREMAQRPEDYAPAYLVHEFMPAAWRPLYATEVRAAMATIGLTPVGSATLSETLDWMVLDEAARKTLATISKLDARELVRDFYLSQRVRFYVFSRCN